MDNYKFFDASIWKYSIYVEWCRHTFYLFPLIQLLVNIRPHNRPPVVGVQIYFVRWTIMLSYQEDGIPEYSIFENDFIEK